MNKEISNLLRSDKEMKELYYSYQKSFFNKIARKYAFSDSYVLEDIYQESFLSLMKALERTTINSWKDYLYKIGERKLFLHFKQENRYPDVVMDNLPEEVESYYETEEWERMCQIVHEYVTVLENPCKQVLNLYYWSKKSMNEIAQIMGYKNERVARSRKFACMQSMRQVVMEKLAKEGLI